MIQVEAGITGRISLPAGGWPQPGGGHAMLIVGYDDADGTWLIRNSWGADWGEGGYARVPYQVMERYGMPTQFWVIGRIESAQGVRVSGTTVQASQEAIRSAAPAQAQNALAHLRGSLRHKLETDLAAAKAGFRERLRGPGAGGGHSGLPGSVRIAGVRRSHEAREPRVDAGTSPRSEPATSPTRGATAVAEASPRTRPRRATAGLR